MTNAFDWDTLSPEERLVAEQAILNLRSLNKACDAAPDGKVLAIAERLAMDQGREQIRQTLEISLSAQATEVEKKGARPKLFMRWTASTLWTKSTESADGSGRSPLGTRLLSLREVHYRQLRIG